LHLFLLTVVYIKYRKKFVALKVHDHSLKRETID